MPGWKSCDAFIYPNSHGRYLPTYLCDIMAGGGPPASRKSPSAGKKKNMAQSPGEVPSVPTLLVQILSSFEELLLIQI